MENFAKKTKLLLLVLIQIQEPLAKSKGPGVPLVMQKPKNPEMLVIVEVMP